MKKLAILALSALSLTLSLSAADVNSESKDYLKNTSTASQGISKITQDILDMINDYQKNSGSMSNTVKEMSLDSLLSGVAVFNKLAHDGKVNNVDKQTVAKAFLNAHIQGLNSEQNSELNIFEVQFHSWLKPNNETLGDSLKKGSEMDKTYESSSIENKTIPTPVKGLN